MLPQVLRTAKDLAVVAASQRTSVLHSRTGRPAVQPRSWGQPAGRFRILSALSAAEPGARGCTAGLKPSYMMEAVSQMTRALYNRAVVAAHDRLLGFRSRVPMLAAETKVAVKCAQSIQRAALAWFT